MSDRTAWPRRLAVLALSIRGRGGDAEGRARLDGAAMSALVRVAAALLACGLLAGPVSAYNGRDLTAKDPADSVARTYSSPPDNFMKGYLLGFIRGVFLRDRQMSETPSCSISGIVLQAYLETALQGGLIKPTDNMDLALYALMVEKCFPTPGGAKP